MSNVGHAQLRDQGAERALITSGDDLLRLKSFLGTRDTYNAGDVIDYLMGSQPDGAVEGDQVACGASNDH
jgi:hypothetical protein